MGRGKHQFDVVENIDSEHVFGQDGGLIEQVFPIRWTGERRTDTMRARVFAVVLVVAVFLLVAPGLARGDGPDRPAPQVTYVVVSGDTLWSIAQQVAPGQDPRPVVDGMIEVNDLHGGLQAGQELVVPVPER